MTIDSKDRVWLLTRPNYGGSDKLVMINNMTTTSFDVIGQSTRWISLMGIDENDQVWVMVEIPDSPKEIYRFDGNTWVFQEKMPSVYTNSELPCCLRNNEMTVTSAQFKQYSAFLEFANFGDRELFLQDKQGNMWAGTITGLAHFSSDFHPSFPLRALHIFLTFGGYLIIGVIITSIYFARLLKNEDMTLFINTKTLFLTKRRAEELHWLIKLSVIGGSAIISAFGSAFGNAFLGFRIFETGENAFVGLYLGFPFGFLIGGGMAMWLLGKQIPVWKVIVVSTLVTILISSLLAAGYYIGLQIY